MVLQVFTTSISGTGVRATLASGDDVFVTANVVVASTDSTAIVGDGSGHRTEIYGTVLANFIGIDIGNSDDDINNVTVIREAGIVQQFSSGGAGIRMTGSGSVLDNRGKIYSPDFAVLMGSTGTGTTKIINTGLIEATEARAIVRFGATTETISTINTGTIRGATASYDGKEGAIGKDLITNNGKMFGDIILGGGDDSYNGTNGRLTGAVFGGVGNDTLRGGVDNDKFNGGDGIDKLFGGNGNDTLNGDVGNDVLQGDAGNDILTGGSGIDTLYGGLGKDTLTGGADKLYGGSGADTFVFRSVKESTVAASGRDTIFDFSQREKDKIDLKAIDADTTHAKDHAFSFIGKKAFSKDAGELRYEKKGGDTIIHGDVNGDGKADFSILVDASIDFTKADFIL